MVYLLHVLIAIAPESGQQVRPQCPECGFDPYGLLHESRAQSAEHPRLYLKRSKAKAPIIDVACQEMKRNEGSENVARDQQNVGRVSRPDTPIIFLSGLRTRPTLLILIYVSAFIVVFTPFGCIANCQKTQVTTGETSVQINTDTGQFEKLLGTYQFDVCPGRTTFLLTLNSDRRFETSEETDIGRLWRARGRFKIENNVLILLPETVSIPGWIMLTEFYVIQHQDGVYLVAPERLAHILTTVANISGNPTQASYFRRKN